MDILIYGIGGKMGRNVYNAVKNYEGANALLGIDKFANPNDFDIPVFKSLDDVNIDKKPDCIIDFSVKEAIYDIIPYAVKNNVPVVLCTTGYGAEEMALIRDASTKIAVFRSGNMSLGVNTLIKLVKSAATLLGQASDVEIIEMHHNQKVDAPSGTAIMLADAVKSVIPDLTDVNGRKGIVGKRNNKEIGIHAVRGGSIVGKHEVMFIMDNEIVTLKHEAESKTVFANGAVRAAIFMKDKPAGIYDMQDVLF